MSRMHFQANVPTRPGVNTPANERHDSLQDNRAAYDDSRTASKRPSSPDSASSRRVLAPAWLDFVKRWSPAFFPPVAGILLLLLAILFSNQHGTAGAPIVSPTTLIELLVFYLVLGMIWGFGLYLATDNTPGWLLMVLRGLVSYVVVTASVYWGIIGGVVLVVLLAALVAWYGRRRAYEVPTGSTAVTTLAGAYFRTLAAGVWMLAPGERVHKTLELRVHTLVCGPTEVLAQSEDGQPLIARAAAVIGFRIAHSAAHRVVLTAEAWTNELRDTAVATLELSLDEWARLPQDDSVEHPAEQLCAIYRRALIERAGELGIRDITVHMQDVSLQNENEKNRSDTASDQRRILVEPPQPGAEIQRASTTPLPTPASGSYAPFYARPATPDDLAAPPPLPDALDPETLTGAYQAIAEQRITDPVTIRAIAEAFASLARDPLRAAQVNFDAESAARILMGHAAKLERSRKQ